MSDQGVGVAVDGSGNIYMLGNTYSFGAGAQDVVVVKYDSTGSIVWQKTWGGSGYDSPVGIGLDASGNVYVGGSTGSFNATGKTFVIKFDSGGNLQWQKVWGGGSYDSGYGFTADSAGNSYLVGYSGSVATHGFILKFDTNGALQWETSWGGNGEQGYGVTVDSSGNVYVTGTTHTYHIGTAYVSVFVLKLNSAGVLQWQRTWGGNNSDYSTSIGVDSSGNLIVGGYTYSYGSQQHTFILKIDTNGNLLWQRVLLNIPNPIYSGGTPSVATDSSGNVLLESFGWGGQTLTGSVILAKISGSGNLLWEVMWGGSDDNFGYGVAVDSGGNAVVTGSAGGPPPYSFTSTNPALATSSFSFQTPMGSLTTLSLGTYSPAGTVTIPSGSQTYAGSGDAFLFTVPSSGPTNVVRPPSSIQLSIPIQTIITGSTVKFSGTITPAVNTTVSLTYIRPDSTSVNRTVTSDATGAFVDSFSPDRSGSWQVRASWSGNSQTSGAQSPLQGFQVQDAPSFLATSLPWLILVAVVIGFGVALVLTKPKAPKMG